MSSWVHYVPLDDHPYYINEGAEAEGHNQSISYWELPVGVNPENVTEVRIANGWSV